MKIISNYIGDFSVPFTSVFLREHVYEYGNGVGCGVYGDELGNGEGLRTSYGDGDEDGDGIGNGWGDGEGDKSLILWKIRE